MFLSRCLSLLLIFAMVFQPVSSLGAVNSGNNEDFIQVYGRIKHKRDANLITTEQAEKEFQSYWIDLSVRTNGDVIGEIIRSLEQHRDVAGTEKLLERFTELNVERSALIARMTEQVNAAPTEEARQVIRNRWEKTFISWAQPIPEELRKLTQTGSRFDGGCFLSIFGAVAGVGFGIGFIVFIVQQLRLGKLVNEARNDPSEGRRSREQDINNKYNDDRNALKNSETGLSARQQVLLADLERANQLKLEGATIININGTPIAIDVFINSRTTELSQVATGLIQNQEQLLIIAENYARDLADSESVYHTEQSQVDARVTELKKNANFWNTAGVGAVFGSVLGGILGAQCG